MGKVNPFILKLPERKVHRITLKDSDHPGCEVSLMLRAPDSVDAINIESETARMVQTYLEEKLDFPLMVEGEIELTEAVIRTAVSLSFFQTGPKEDRYSPEEILAMSATMPQVWEAWIVFAEQISTEGNLGKGMEMAMESLHQPSSDGRSDIPNLMPE